MANPRPVEVVAVLHMAMLKIPSQRLCQIIVNATHESDPFHVTDERLIRDVRAYVALYGAEVAAHRTPEAPK